MRQGLADYVELLEHAVDADAVWRTAKDHFAECGADWLFHGYVTPFWHHEHSFYLHYSSIPQWWDRHRDEQGYRHHDPAVKHCLRSTEPFAFGPGLDDARCSAPARRMYAESTEWGANCGVAFPLRNLPGSPLGAMVGITRLDAPEFRRWWSRFHRELHLAALATDMKLLRFFQPPEPVIEITARERECLLWLAAGLRSDRIAHRLGVSTAAVDLHFANVRRKLRARTRDQALLKAVMFGLLVP